MFPFVSPMQAMRLGMQTTQMLAEAQMVIVMRMAGMAGGWNVTGHENTRMVEEKTAAAVAAQGAMIRAALGGANPAAVAMAGLKPIGKTTRANVKRLAKRGPKLG